MSAKRESDGPGQQREGYERPALVVLGAIAELTAGAGGGTTDSAVFSTAVSDRRLKTELRPVAMSELLSALAELPSA
jgi:hypothetical protein